MNFYILIFFFIHTLQGLPDTYDNESIYSTKRWKSIENPSKCNKLIAEMHQQGISSCECIKKMHEEEEKKVLKKRGLNEQEIKEIKQKIAEIKQQNEGPLNLIFNPEIPGDIKKLVEKIASEMQIKGIINFCYTDSVTEVSYRNGKHNCSLNKNDYQKLGFPSIERQCATLRHEFTHIKNKHTQIKCYIGLILYKKTHKFSYSIINYIPFSIASIIVKQQFLNKDAWKSIVRLYEKEADREPAACGMLEDAIVAYKGEIFFEKKCREMLGENWDILLSRFDTTHPPQAKRTLWAKLIMHAKEAESYLYSSHYSMPSFYL